MKKPLGDTPLSTGTSDVDILDDVISDVIDELGSEAAGSTDEGSTTSEKETRPEDDTVETEVSAESTEATSGTSESEEKSEETGEEGVALDGTEASSTPDSHASRDSFSSETGSGAASEAVTSTTASTEDSSAESSFETSFGLEVAGFKSLEVHVDDLEPVTLGKSDKEDKSSGKEKIETAGKVRTPSEYKDGADGELIRGGHADEIIHGNNGDDFIKAGKGEDILHGGSGDDVLDGGHGNDIIDGGSGSDVINADKGDDVLIYNFGENLGSENFYDGGQGSDTLVIRLTAEEFSLYEDELNELADWIAENADDRRSASKQFNDTSAHSPAHPVFETSFDLHLRHMEDVKFEISDESEPVIEPVVDEAPEPVVEATSEVSASVTGDGPIPIKNVDVSLAEGSQITVDIAVTVEELPAKYDVFMLHDLSGSFWDDLPNVQAQFSGLYDALTAKGDVAFGVGSFIDKPMETFGGSSDYVYNTDLAVTGDKAMLQESLDGLSTGWGYDGPEAQIEALVQTALRGDEIGFRDGAQKFVVLFTDASFHQAGDYAGVAENDYDTVFETEDYPDPAIVGKMLLDAGITPIFAVTSYTMATYQELVDSWGAGIVTELTSDSSNIADAIFNGLTEAPTNLELDISGDDYGFVSAIEPPIYEDVEPGTYTFSVTMEIPEDSEGYSSDSMTFEVTGYGEVSVNVAIEKIDITGDVTDDTLTGDAGPNGIYGMDGDDMLVGTGGDDQLFGGNGNDFLVGGGGNDDYTGGAGSDVFAFESAGGADTVTDFEVGDTLDLRRMSSVSSYAEVLAAATQVGSDVVIDFGEGSSVTLLGVSSEELLEETFLF